MNRVDIDLNVSSNLSKEERQSLEGMLSGYENVVSARFNRNHMLSVSYDCDEISSSVILKYVGDRGIDVTRSMY